MSILEALYSYEIPKINYKDRKFVLEKENTILFYPSGSGATYCLFNFLSFLDKHSYLYIDFDDLRVDIKNIRANLNNFVHSKKDIEVLVIDNFDFSFEISNKTINILSTRKEKIKKRNYKMEVLYPLDFEEYTSFHSFINIQNVFSDFIQDSSLPLIATTNKELKVQETSKYIKNQSKNETELEILKEIIKSQGLLKTNYQLFNSLKNRIKISKNKLYEFISSLESREIIFLIEKHDTKNSPKKIQLIDFSLNKAINFDKNLYTSIENAIFLELLKQTKESIYYTDNLNFYIPPLSVAIIVSLFMEKEILKDKIKKHILKLKKLKLKKVIIINISEESSFFIENVEFIITPFYTFASNDLL